MVTHKLISNAGFTIYEYAVTFDREVVHVWTRKPSASSLLLLSIRWIMVLTQVFNLTPPEPSLCKSPSCTMHAESQISIYRCTVPQDLTDCDRHI